mgnify:CR=1 FL=1
MYLFFDTETTGLSSNQDHIVQLAWILTDQDGNVIRDAVHVIYPQGYTIPWQAAAIHGITTDHAKRNGIPLKTVLSEFSDAAISAKALIAHNLSFDLGFLRSSYSRTNTPSPLNGKTEFCTMKSSTDWCKLPPSRGKSGYKWPKLTELHYRIFKYEFPNAHNAQADVQACMNCFWKLVDLGVITIPSHLRSSQTSASSTVTPASPTNTTTTPSVRLNTQHPTTPSIAPAPKPTPQPVKISKLVTDEEELKSPAYLQTIRRILDQTWKSSSSDIGDLPNSIFNQEDLDKYGLDRCRYIARAGLIAKYVVSSEFRNSTKYLQLNIDDSITKYGNVMLDLVFRVTYDHHYQWLTYISWQDTINKAKSLMEQKRQEEARIKARDAEIKRAMEEQSKKSKEEDAKKQELFDKIKSHNTAVGRQVNQLAGLNTTTEKPNQDALNTKSQSDRPKYTPSSNSPEVINHAAIIESPIKIDSPKEQKKFFPKLITGEYGLAKTFWIFGIIPDFIIYPVIMIIENSLNHNHDIPSILVFMLITYLIYRPIVLIGTWHASTAYSGLKLWKYLSRAHVILGALGALGGVVELIKDPQYPGTNSFVAERPSSARNSTNLTSNTGKSAYIPSPSTSFANTSKQTNPTNSWDTTSITPAMSTPTSQTGKYPIYFAADLPPTDNIPSEAPLCYKFMVEGLEEQLKKLKKKYPDLYGYSIYTNSGGSKTLIAKRKDKGAKEISYFYSTSPNECTKHQKSRNITNETKPPIASQPRLDGVYTGNGSNADLRIFVENGGASFKLRGNACTGELEGIVEVVSKDNWRVIASESSCVINMQRDSPLSFTVQEGLGCTHYHGFRCEFTGYVTKSQ